MKTTTPTLVGAFLLFQSIFAGSTIQFQTRMFTVAETAGQVALTVVRSNDLETEVAVEFYSIQVTATDGADFAAVSGTCPLRPE
jgi:hypothetical protein